MSEPIWWALALLPLEEQSLEAMVRRRHQAGTPNLIGLHPVGEFAGPHLSAGQVAEMWERLCAQSYILAERKPIEAWRTRAFAEREQGGKPAGPIAQAVRHAALSCERSFAQFCNLRDDEGEQIRHAPFHVQTIRALRQEPVTAVFLPLEHGKSYLTSIQVPLMDWGEWPNATQGRIYWSDKHAFKWTARLMAEVEFNHDLQSIFPWIRRPAPEDRSRSWAKDGFSIAGRSIADRSFEAWTAQAFPVGLRYSRPIGDDWVNRGNCRSFPVQDKLYDSFYEGVLTMGQHVRRTSVYGTVWGNGSYVGTLYDRRDCGSRIGEQIKSEGGKVVRFDVYPVGAKRPDLVLWPEGRDADWVAKRRSQMPVRSFNARYRNMVVDEGMETFPIDLVQEAVKEWAAFGDIPEGARAVIGYDPAWGTQTRFSADPAICVYAEVPDLNDEGIETGAFTAHFVAWERLIGYDFHRQLQTIINWSQRYLLPVVIEKNTLGKSYGSELRRMAPDVKVYDHQTGAEKWDPDDGVETFTPLFHNHRAVIHAGGAPQSELRALVEQFVEWPQVDKEKKDLLMAFWFARSKLRKQQRPKRRLSVVPDLPDYIDPHYFNIA